MANRATNQGLLDANSQSPVTFTYSPLINVNTTTSVLTTPGIFRGFTVISAGSGAWTVTAYDALPTGTLNSTTAIGVLGTTTGSGINPNFQWMGDIVLQNGLTIVGTTGTAGAFKVIYL